MKPLGRKNYGSIGHLPESRLGPGDHSINPGQARILTERARDKHDTIIVQEKLDGSNVGVAKVNGQIIALGRSGYLAQTSKYEMHHLFADWVRKNHAIFDDLLNEGERVVGEWLAQAHGTIYNLWHDPFVPFDIMTGEERLNFDEFTERTWDFVTANILHYGSNAPLAVKDALDLLGEFGHHGAQEPAEGVVYRVERKGKVDFLAKYVRHDKIDGKYLKGDPIWNWRPE